MRTPIRGMIDEIRKFLKMKDRDVQLQEVYDHIKRVFPITPEQNETTYYQPN